MVALETAPARVLDFSGSLENLPNLARLKEHAWVATNHYSTFPNSAAALFSLMSSFYGGDPRRLFSKLDSVAPSFLHGLRSAGYRTALYLPNGALNSAGVRMYRAVGFDAYHHPSPGPNELTVWSAPWRDRERLDRAALNIMLDDIRGAATESSPFAAVFWPQMSHAPWVDVFEDGEPRTIADRGLGVFAKVDRYIGDIIQTLGQTASLDRTLIVVTGDHGIRVRKEDPSLPLGKVDAYSFHVPFLLYAPGILDQTTQIPWVTSHIDLSPTLSDLFGLELPPASTQGSVIWDPKLKNRTTFFWAEELHGSVGLHRDGKFLMWNTFYDRVYQNSPLSFDSRHIVPNDSELYAETTALFRQMQNINRRWINLKIRTTQSRSE